MAQDITYVVVGAATGAAIIVTAGVVVAAIGARVATVVDRIRAVVAVPNVTSPFVLPAIGTGASRGFPILYIAKLDY